MPAERLGLYDLLAPQFLAGFSFPDYIDDYLNILAVDQLRMTFDDNMILYTGRASFGGDGVGSPVLKHRDPSGAVFEWEDISIDFRLLVPRAGSQQVNQVVNMLAANPPNLQRMKDLADSLGNPAAMPTDYPGIAFQLELLFNLVTFHLGKTWVPGVVDPATFRVVPDKSGQYDDVRFLLPKLKFVLSQGQAYGTSINFQFASWGDPGFDAPSDTAAGELVRMEPAIALHESGRFGFGIDQVLLDLSPNSTPPEILKHFGTDESWQGIFIKSLRFFYSDKSKDFALGFSVRDALISFAGEVSLEAQLDIIGAEETFKVSVALWDGYRRIDYNHGSAVDASKPRELTGGSAILPTYGVIHVEIMGGTPPLDDISVVFTPLNGGPQNLWKPAERLAKFDPEPANHVSGTLEVTVRDSSSPQLEFKQTISLQVVKVLGNPGGSPLDRPPVMDRKPAVLAIQGNPPSGYTISHIPSAFGTHEMLIVRGGDKIPTVKIDGQNRPVDASRVVILEVGAGTTKNIVVEYPASDPLPGEFRLLFDYERPNEGEDLDLFVADNPVPPAPVYSRDNPVPSKAGQPLPGSEGKNGAEAVVWWMQNCLVSPNVSIAASASYEDDPNKASYNLHLSERRAEVARRIITNSGGTAPAPAATGQTQAEAAGRTRDQQDRVAILTGTPKAGAGQVTINATIAREAGPPPPPPPIPPQQLTPSAPPPAANQKPPVFRRASLRFRLERNVPVLAEIFGELDFETEMEGKLRNEKQYPQGGLGLQPRNGATNAPNPEDGVVDFKLNVTYDTSTHYLTETISVGAHPGDRDGLLQMTNPNNSELKNALGAVLLFAPLTNAASSALPEGSAGDWVVTAVALGVPVAIGALGFFRTKTATLYGAEAKARQHLASGQQPTEFTDFGLIFDYGVSFEIHVDALGIHSTRPLSVRYKALGFNIYQGQYQPIFDTSRGYEIDLSDPGLFNLPAGLGDLLKILSARISRFNPLMLEVDLAVNADLGVVTVDRFKVRVPLDPPGVPQIIPGGAKVDIPGVLRGTGRVDIKDTGFAGSLDLTLVPLKLRIAAALAVLGIEDPATQRKATAVYFSLAVDFPTPIVLGATGLGIFGFSGIFAMHFKRIEDPQPANSAVPPALAWLEKANGRPENLELGVTWGPEFDKWAFGIGMVLGTLEGGFLVNLRGTVMLELPGPRILVFVKCTLLGTLPGRTDAFVATGILGVLDLDFGAGKVTIGVIINIDVEKLIVIKVPLELFFNWNQSSDWHVWIGTYDAPASANILGVVKGSGYFMIQGNDLTFPPGSSSKLSGIAVACGVRAPIIWGSEEAGVYLKIAISADLGVSFSPFRVIGLVRLEGELRLVIISIGASGEFLVAAPDPFELHVKICGSIDLFFFEIEACVEFGTEPSANLSPAPPLIGSLYLQSNAPIIAAGQGGDRPIDASLGNAVESGGAGDLPVVPIDSIPVIRMQYSPDSDAGMANFIELVAPSPIQVPANGIPTNGDQRLKYLVKEVTITPDGGSAISKPPAVWRREQLPSASKSVTSVDLALMTRVPVTASHAVERSTELSNQIDAYWGDLCKPLAPPACVLWTFCRQKLGRSGKGWKLIGTAMPDPPNTYRPFPVNTKMNVDEPPFTAQAKMLEALAAANGKPFYFPAEVIGYGSGSSESSTAPCQRGLQLPDSEQISLANPMPLKPAVVDAINKRASMQFVTLNTGSAARVRIYLAVDRRLTERTAQGLVIRELDANGAVLKETPFLNLNPVVINGSVGLPTEWLDPAKPWRQEVLPITQFFAMQPVAPLVKYFVQISPKAEATKIQIAVLSTVPAGTPPPTVVLGVIEVCSRAEMEQYADAIGIQKSKIETLQGYLDGGALVPLLEPDKTYTVKVKYDATAIAKDGQELKESREQSYRFKTDKTPPKRFDPWVLTTGPAEGDQFHFYEDPVVYVFNDDSGLQLFDAYGYKLRVDVRSADGLPMPHHDVQNTVKIDGFGSAYYDQLKDLIDSGQFPCVGEIHPWQWSKFTAPIVLQPLMAYTLDIVSDPVINPPPGQAMTPLFRRAFSTSRFASAEAMMKEVAASKIRHRALNAAINLPPGLPVVTVTDREIEVALTTAGEQALPAPEDTGVTVYWVKKAQNLPYSPHAILIDGAEPFWRKRPAPKLEAVDANDPTFVQVVLDTETALEMVELGGSSIARFVKSTGGTRTLAFISAGFNPPPAGQTIDIALHRPGSTLYDLNDLTTTPLRLRLQATAPWEADHE